MTEQSNDRGTIRLIIILIGVLAVGFGVSVVYLTSTNTGGSVPEQLWLILTALVSALITLATTRSRPNDAPEVYKETFERLAPHNGEQFGTPEKGPA